jgi:TolB-like protein
MADVFISYSRSDAAIARRFAEAFEAQGLSVWWDDALRSGDIFDEAIEQALKQAKAVVVLWSKASVVSRWVRAEATLADRNKTLLPVMIEQCERPIIFELTHAANLERWQGASEDAKWLAFVADVRRFVASTTAERPVRRDAAAIVPHAAPAKPLEPVLAVLPFDNLSSDPEMQFFSDGVSEEIIQQLSRGAQIKVIGRTSSFQFRGDRKAQAAPALRCTHVLDGSIRRAANRVRIAAHLVETASQTTLWSDRYDRGLEDIFAVQDEISEHISAALHRTFNAFSSKAVDPAAYDLYLRASPRSYAPSEARTNIGLLEVATRRAPHFAEAWGRLAYLRAFLRFYQPFADHAACAGLVEREAERALAIDPDNIDALTAKFFLVPPYGRFAEADQVIERIRQATGPSDGQMFIGWHARAIGRTRDSAEETERIYRLDPLNPMLANAVALGRMATGRIAEAAPVLEDLVARVPDMSFPVANLLRAKAFLKDWAAIDRLLDPAAGHPLREFQDGLAFIRAKRDPSAENIGAIRSALRAHVSKTGCVDLSRLVYAAHLGLVEEAYGAAESARLGPRGTSDDVMGPDAYRTGILFWAEMGELRSDPRFVRLCARLGLVEFWMATSKWPDCAGEVPYDFKAECEKAHDIPKEDFGF